MSEDRPRSAPGAERDLTAAALAVIVASALLVAHFLFLPVRIDGVLTWVVRGTTAADLARDGRLDATQGALVSLSGRLLRVGAGKLPTARIGGVSVEASAPIASGSRLVSVHGADTVESLATSTVETTQLVRFVGSGPAESVEESGTPGTAEVVAGSFSGEEVSRRVLSIGSAMTIRREPAWPGRKEVALTFDDGPWPGSTDAIVSQLVEADAKATFFMLGRQVRARPVQAKRVTAAGMEVGNHSYSHKYLRRASDKLITSEITRGSAAIKSVLGVTPVWYRPAGGSRNAFVARESRRLGLRVIMWTIDPKDWKRPRARVIARRVLDRVRPGSVILLHDGGGDRKQTVAALGLIIRGLKARGYSMVTLSRLYRLPGATQ